MLQKLEFGGHSGEVCIGLAVVGAVKGGGEHFGSRLLFVGVVDILDEMSEGYGVIAVAVLSQTLAVVVHIETNIKKVERIEAIHNAVVLPYNKNRNLFGFSHNLEYIGFSKANWLDDSSNAVVHAFLIDTKHLIYSW